MQFRATAKQMESLLSPIPTFWDGKRSVLEMKNAGYTQWRQTEWMGWYFQYLCAKHLPMMKVPGPKYGNAEFDGFFKIPWDFKAHAMNTSSHQLIVNDSQAMSKGIAEYGFVGLILAMGKVEYNDEERAFQQWHTVLKGGMSDYERERIKTRRVVKVTQGIF